MIHVIAVFDVYSAGDPKQRLAAPLARYNQLCATSKNPALHAARDHCAMQLTAIEEAKSSWTRLRQTDLTALALNNALVPVHDAKA